MLVLVDSADLTQIGKVADKFPIDGVTTNPSLIAKDKIELFPFIEGFFSRIGREKLLHIQILSQKTEDIVEEALFLNEKFGGNLYIKIPVTPSGIKAIQVLKKYDVKLTATAVFTPQQAVMAAKAGADFVAPYVNRLDNICTNGISVVEEIISIFQHYKFTTKILAASFKNVEQVHQACLKGVHGVTLSTDLIEQLLYHPMTSLSIENFIADWEEFYGVGTKIHNLK